jgi:SAM-dependent methyltransferase
MTQRAGSPGDVFSWIEENLRPERCDSTALLYDHMASQSHRSLPIIYQPFDAARSGHWRDRGAAFDYLSATQAEGRRVLDFGPGDGWPSLIVAPYVREVVGVDGSQRRVEVCCENAARLGLSNARFVRVPPGSPLPFDEGTFDAAMAASSVEQSPDPQATLRELYRVLRPGGRLRVSYEALNRYRGEEERGAWLMALDEGHCKLVLYDRDIDGERARQVAVTCALSAEAAYERLAPGVPELSFDVLDAAHLEAIRPAVVAAQVCTTLHPSGPTLARWLREAGFDEVRPTHSGASFAGALSGQLAGDPRRPADMAGGDALLRPAVEVVCRLPAPLEDDPMITAVKGAGAQSMDLVLGVALSCSGPRCRVQLVEGGTPFEARRSAPMLEYGIDVAPGQPVVIDRGSDPPRVVYRLDGIQAERAPEGYVLREGGTSVEPRALGEQVFDRIRALHER